ncbi:MAG: universal stress protein [Acidimicrobiia bacterium]|nr:universal stress protein [Acidimicrobiia bacterium]
MVNEFKNVLVTASPGHLESTTLRRAVRLAGSNSARLTVIDVVKPVGRRLKSVEVEGSVVDIEDSLLRDSEDRLRHLAKAAGVGPDVVTTVMVGEPFVEVIHHVLANGIDLVVIGEPPVPKGQTPVLSPGVMKLLRKCPVPLWVMRPSRARKLRVLALVDPDPGDPVRDGLNHQVMDLAVSLVRSRAGELHIGHAWHLTGESTLRMSPYVGLPGPMVDAMVASVEEHHREQLEALAAQHHADDVSASVHMVAGDARDVLPGLVERVEAGVVVMGTVARTGLSGLIIGNTAEAILGSIRCSMLAVKPEGFVTPVKPERKHP